MSGLKLQSFFFFLDFVFFTFFRGWVEIRASRGVGRQTPGTHVLLEIMITNLTV